MGYWVQTRRGICSQCVWVTVRHACITCWTVLRMSLLTILKQCSHLSLLSYPHLPLLSQHLQMRPLLFSPSTFQRLPLCISSCIHLCNFPCSITLSLNSFLILFPSFTPSTPLTSNWYHSYVAPSTVHLRAKEPAVLDDGVALDAAEWVAGTTPAAHAEQNTWGGGGGHRGNTEREKIICTTTHTTLNWNFF